MTLLHGKLATPDDVLAIRAFDVVARALPCDSHLLRRLEIWVLPDLAVGRGVHVLHLFRLDAVAQELGEVSLIFGRILLLQHLHVFFNMVAKDAVFVGLGIILRFCTLLLSWLEAWEVLGAVWHVQTTIGGSFESTPQSGADACALQSNIENDLEGFFLIAILFLFNMVLLTVDFLSTLECLVQSKFLEHSAGNEETSGIRSSVVFVSNWNAEVCEFRRGCLADDLVPSNGRISHLANHLGIGEAHYQPVLLVVVLVFVLANHLPTGLEVSLALPATTLRNLVALKVRLVLEDFDERHTD